MKSLFFATLMVGAVACWVAGAIDAGECGTCNQCGCCSPCQKVCRLMCETKKVTKVTYTCECEDFCVPGPSDRCKVPNCDCDSCHKYKIHYTPTCAEVKTRTKLVKHEKVEEKPSYKWVVEYCCPPCATRCANETAVHQQQMTAGGPSTFDASPMLPPQPPAAADVAPKSQLRRVLDTFAPSH